MGGQGLPVRTFCSEMTTLGALPARAGVELGRGPERPGWRWWKGPPGGGQ